MNHGTQITQHESRITSHASRFLALVCVMSLLLGLAGPALAQDDITFTASVNRTTISTDDTLTLQLTLAGAFSGANQPQLPALEGFAVVGTSQSSQFSIVNGKTPSQVVFNYRLQPTQVGTWLWDRRRHHLAHNVAYARAQRARRQARKRLSEARKLVETDQDAAYAAVARALTAYLGDKFNLPAAGLTRDAIQRTLSASPISEELVARLLTCLDWADSGRFAPVAAGRDVNNLIQEAEEIITQLEERIT